jgi:hypothetical protein
MEVAFSRRSQHPAIAVVAEFLKSTVNNRQSFQVEEEDNDKITIDNFDVFVPCCTCVCS